MDSKTQKPVPAALVLAVASGLPPFSKRTKSGGDGAFQLRNLPAGKFSLCVQVSGDRYLDPCQWNDSPNVVTLASGQAVSGVLVKVDAASILYIQITDPQQFLSQKTKDGRRPDLALGVTGPRGLSCPAHGGSRDGALVTYQLAVPRDTGLKLSIASHALKLGDANGVPLPANANQQAFQHATGDPNPKGFAFTILGLAP